MVFAILGLNHKTAPLAVREKMAPSCENTLLTRLMQQSFITEAVILSTCNRTEIYCDTTSPNHLLDWFADENAVSTTSILPYIYQYQEIPAIQHLLRVSVGLDSMMLGEPQILGQLKKAFRQAEESHSVKHTLRYVFPFIFSISKRIRHESGIGNNPVSVASAAVHLIGQLFTHFKSLSIVVIGSGETASLVAKYLYQQGARNFSIASRTRENADKLALQWHARSLSITDIPTHLPEADVVISATACPLPFIDKNMLIQSIGLTRVSPLFLLDLAVPRDIDLNVSQLDYVHLYNIDDLHQAIEKGLSERQAAAKHAEQLIDKALTQYATEHRIRAAQQAICNYREHMQLLADMELERVLKKMNQVHGAESVLREFTNRLINKMTHITTIGLRQAAADARADLLSFTEYLLNTNLSSIKNEKIT